MTVEIPLSNGMIALVDDDDAQLARPGWYPSKSKKANTWYARTNIRQADGRWAGISMHTMLTGWKMVDHRNGNGLDNRRANLRNASKADNMRNSRKRKGPATSRYKGVHWHRASGRWAAEINVSEQAAEGGCRRRRIHLGLFRTETAAAHAYDDAARRHFGQYAAVNFPTGTERSAIAPDPPTGTTDTPPSPRSRRMTDALRQEARSRAANGEAVKDVAEAMGFCGATISKALGRTRPSGGTGVVLRRSPPRRTAKPLPPYCQLGHPLSHEMVYVLADGRWRCAACARERTRAYYQARRATKAGA